MSRHSSALAKLLTPLVMASAVCLAAQSAMAANGTWVTDDGTHLDNNVYPSWPGYPLNWVGGVIPGTTIDPSIATPGAVNTDIATFSTLVSTGVPNVNSAVGSPGYIGGFLFTGNVNWPGAGTSSLPLAFFVGNLSPDNPATSTQKSIVFDSSYSAAAGQYFILNGSFVLNNPAGSPLASNFSIINNSPAGSNITIENSNAFYGNTVGMTNLILGGSNPNSTWITPSAGSSAYYEDGALATTPIAGAASELTKTGTGTWTISTESGSNTCLSITGPINVQQGTLILNGNASYSGDVHLGGSTLDNATSPTRIVNVAYGANLGTTNGASTNALGMYIRSTKNSGQGDVGYILQGNGTIVGATTATYGTVTWWDSAHSQSPSVNYGLIKPGDPINTTSAVGTLTTGNEIWANRYGLNMGYSWGVNSVSGSGLQAAATNANSWTGGSQLVINGTLDVSHLGTDGANPGQFNIYVNGYAGTAAGAVSGWSSTGNYKWDIATFSGGVTGGTLLPDLLLNTTAFAADNTVAVGPGLGFSLTADANNLYLNYTGSTVPEPGTVAMLLSGIVGLGLFAWRRKRAG